jgi:hypothetical protein
MPESFCQLADNRLPERQAREAERGAVPAGGFAIRSRAALGIMPFGITTEARGAVSGLGQAKADNARRNYVPGSLA